MNFEDRVILLIAHPGGPGDYLLPSGSEGSMLDPFTHPDDQAVAVTFDALPLRPRCVRVRDLRMIGR